MTSKQVLAISLRLLGIYSFIQAVSLLQPFGVFASAYSKMLEGDLNYPLMYFAALLPSIALMILAFVLLFYANRIANALKVHNQSFQNLETISSKGLQSLAFSVVGVIMVLFGLIHIVRSASSILLAFQSVNDTSQLVNVPYTISVALQLLFGLVLFVGARPLAMFWHRLKYEWSVNKEDS